MFRLLAQSPYTAPTAPGPTANNGEPFEVFFYALLILFAAALLGGVAYVLRKRLMQPDEPDVGAGFGFTLADLRQMHAAGELTDDEFTQAKRKIVATARASMAEDESDPEDAEIVFDDDGGGADRPEDTDDKPS